VTQEAWVQTGIQMKREWISTMDGRAREEHIGMDGQLVGLDEPFEVKSGRYRGAKAMAPGSFGIGALDIGCRCAQGSVLPDDEEDRHMIGTHCIRVKRGEKLSQQQRVQMWRAFDEALAPWDVRLERAIAAGFESQMKAVLAAIAEVNS
jgi:uncharacterized protein with gpF-like domain